MKSLGLGKEYFYNEFNIGKNSRITWLDKIFVGTN